jgi:SAM-dependent methyltransferase
MSQQHLQAFLADLRTINPRININDTFGKRTSLSGLLTHLQATVNAPAAMTALEARQHCANQFDPSLTKYSPAIERLVSVWGRGAHRHYPQAAGFVPVVNHLNVAAQNNFNAHVATVPVHLRPAYASLENFDDDPWLFNNSLGAGYLHRVVNPGQAPLDITSRGLLLKAGLSVPIPMGSDNGYIASLQLTNDDLTRMQGHSILDVGCGAAIFRAEMEALYGCNTTGVDLNHAHIGPAVANGQSRYVCSTLYLKMLKDKGRLQSTSLPAWSTGFIDRQITDFQNILNAFQNNLPINGDVFHLSALDQTWDFTVSMFLLCYFNAAEQTAAVLEMCAVTNNTVFLHSGQGSVQSPRLVYDQAQVHARFPGVAIIVKDESTHHIVMP